MLSRVSREVDSWRLFVSSGCRGLVGTPNGMFLVPKVVVQSRLGRHDRADVKIIAYDGTLESDQWEHVSVSLLGKSRCPDWSEMCLVKSLFWGPEEAVMQLHPPASQYVNNHPYCLHLWRLRGFDMPLPNPATVGVLGG